MTGYKGYKPLVRDDTRFQGIKAIRADLESNSEVWIEIKGNPLCNNYIIKLILNDLKIPVKAVSKIVLAFLKEMNLDEATDETWKFASDLVEEINKKL